MALVQVIIPAYNVAPFIRATIDSVINQKFTNWEAIILDDCSTDGTPKIALEYANADSRISFIKNETNLGMMANWNKGISLCNAKYFIKLDADDLLHPNSLKEAVHILENDQNIGMVVSNFKEIDEYGNHNHNQAIFADFDLHNQGKFSALDLVRKGPNGMFSYGISIQGILLIRTSVLEKAGPYLPFLWGDQEMWFRLGSICSFFYIPEILYFYRKRNNSSTALLNKDLAPKGFYDTRTSIFNHYLTQNLLTISEHKAFVDETIFIYNSYLIYRARMNGQYVEMLRHLFHNFSIFPKKTMFDNLHINRLWGKN
jgi:glycosyltransferase involved in cell wall biosynthesis